jgi:hypothetical protein
MVFCRSWTTMRTNYLNVMDAIYEVKTSITYLNPDSIILGEGEKEIDDGGERIYGRHF